MGIDNQIFKNWWHNKMKVQDPLENAFVVNYPSTTVPTHDGYNTNYTQKEKEYIINTLSDAKVVDIRYEMIKELFDHVEDIFQKLNEHEKRINKIEDDSKEITLEKAIDFLQDNGWLKEHDKELTQHYKTKVKNAKYSKNFWSASGECENCKARLDKRYTFCPYCGAKLIWS